MHILTEYIQPSRDDHQELLLFCYFVIENKSAVNTGEGFFLNLNDAIRNSLAIQLSSPSARQQHFH